MNLLFTPEQIEQFPFDRLIPNARNARTHSKEQIAEIAASFQAFGFMSVILVDEHDRILAGDGSVLGATAVTVQPGIGQKSRAGRRLRHRYLIGPHGGRLAEVHPWGDQSRA